MDRPQQYWYVRPHATRRKTPSEQQAAYTSDTCTNTGILKTSKHVTSMLYYF